MGAPLTINLAPQATFSIDTSGSMLPAGLNFASSADSWSGKKSAFIRLLRPARLPT